MWNPAEVKLIQADDCRLAFDINSGSLHELDEVAWDLLWRFQERGDWQRARREASLIFGKEPVQAAAAEVETLHESGSLFTPDPGWHRYAPSSNDPSRRAPSAHADGPSPAPGAGLKALCLNLSHDCNMSCGYCFVPSQVRSGQQSMPGRVIRAALDFLLQTSPCRRLAVDFFGGEPLLNAGGVRGAVAYALARGSGRSWKFTLTTNTLLLDAEISSFTAAHDFCLVLSCDGRPGVHDAFRVRRGGGGTAAAVARRLQDYLAVAAGQEHYVRGTYTRCNLDFSEDVRYLAGLGARSISLEPVVAAPGQPYAIRQEDLPAIRAEYFRLARFLRDQERAGSRISFYHFQLDLPGGPCAAKRLTGCGAGYQYLAVTPAGELYPCHQFVGHPEYCLGNLERGVMRPDLQSQFQQAHLYNKPSCSSCWARFLCGGGCLAQAALLSGDLRHPYALTCELTRARLEGALYHLAISEPPGRVKTG